MYVCHFVTSSVLCYVYATSLTLTREKHACRFSWLKSLTGKETVRALDSGINRRWIPLHVQKLHQILLGWSNEGWDRQDMQYTDGNVKCIWNCDRETWRNSLRWPVRIWEDNIKVDMELGCLLGFLFWSDWCSLVGRVLSSAEIKLSL